MANNEIGSYLLKVVNANVDQKNIQKLYMLVALIVTNENIETFLEIGLIGDMITKASDTDQRNFSVSILKLVLFIVYNL